MLLSDMRSCVRDMLFHVQVGNKEASMANGQWEV